MFEFRDRAGPHFGNATLGFARHIFAALKLAFDFDVCALSERLGRFRQAAKGDYAMPIGARDELARLLVFVGALSCERKDDNGFLVRVGVLDRVRAEEAFEGDRVACKSTCCFSISVLIYSGHTWAKPCERARLPSPTSAFSEGPARNLPTGLGRVFCGRFVVGDRDPEGQGKQKTAVAPGAGQAPKQCLSRAGRK